MDEVDGVDLVDEVDGLVQDLSTSSTQSTSSTKPRQLRLPSTSSIVHSLDWESDASHILMNHRLQDREQDKVRVLLEQFHFPGHVWIATSGSTSAAKWVALSKKALLLSAQMVNQHLESTSQDRWAVVLPKFHVGGLGIWARAHLSGASVIDLWGTWNPLRLVEANPTLTSLVPAQVHDLVTQQIRAPKALRAAIVGGGAIDPELYASAKKLGWPLLRSYGLTECASQVATEKEGQVIILPHCKVKIDSEERIWIKSDSLLTGYVLEGRFIDPKENGWYRTEDLGELQGNTLHIKGRVGNIIKIGGENVNVEELQRILQQCQKELNCTADAVLLSVPDPRLGHAIHLFTNKESTELVQNYQKRVLPFERIRQVNILKEIPRNELGKIQIKQILNCT